MSSYSLWLWRRATRYLQLAVAIAAFVYVISLVDSKNARQLLLEANLCLLPVAVTISLSGLFFAGLRWLILMRPLGIEYGPASAFRCYLAGTFYGLAMPGAIGGDIARVLICHHDTGASLGLVTATVFLERCLGFTVLLCILAIGLNVTTTALAAHEVRSVITAIAIVALTTSFAAPWTCRFLSRASAPDSPTKARNHSEKWRRLLSVAGNVRAGSMLLSLILSASFQLADILCTFVVAIALGIELSMSSLLIALPLAYLVTTLPISPAGLGLREASFAFTLSYFGVSGSDAALLALAAFSVRLVVGILGGIQQLLRSTKKAYLPRNRSAS